MESKQNLSSSSIIDLKAELFRKQEEFKKQKLQGKDFVKSKAPEKKPSIWSKQNAGVLQRAQKDIEEKAEEENVYEKSRKALERKSKLYEQISKGNDIPEEDGSKIFLVDFQKKAIDNYREKGNKKSDKNMQEDDILLDDDIPPPQNEGEEWVDYTDALGRSRRCMKKDLPQLEKQDRELTGKHQSETGSSIASKEDSEMPTLLSDDMRKEMLRQKWEKEELEAMNGPIHYSNVRFDEIRSHGVGFYEFDKSDAARQEQMDNLNKLRQETLEERSRKEKIKEKRKALLDARLAKVKQRKLLREGGVLPTEENPKEDEEQIGPKIDEMVTPVITKPELLTRDTTLQQDKPLREWDKGKEKMFPPTSEERYFEERRQERNPDFAPPTALYSEPVKHPTPNTSMKQVKTKVQERNPDFAPSTPLYSEPVKRPTPTTSMQHLNTKTKSDPSHIITGNENTGKSSKEKQTSSTLAVTDIPLPPEGKKRQKESYDKPDYELPYFNPSVPPPNFTQFSTQKSDSGTVGYVGLPHTTGSQFSVQSHNQTLQDVLPPVNWPNIQHTTDQPTNWTSSSEQPSYSQPQHSMQASGTTGIPNSHYSGPTSITCSTASEATQPKPKVNIIDPRFIQNKEVLDQNPGNMTMKREGGSVSGTTECDESMTVSDSIGTSDVGTNSSSSYTAKPLIYK